MVYGTGFENQREQSQRKFESCTLRLHPPWRVSAGQVRFCYVPELRRDRFEIKQDRITDGAGK